MTKISRKLTQAEAQSYWRNPPDAANHPRRYVNSDNPKMSMREDSLLALFEQHVGLDESILEIGCNAGRNLRALMRAGYLKLSAVEINAGAIDVMKDVMPDVFNAVDVRVGPIEDHLKDFARPGFDVVFTMAVLVHLPAESEWVFEEIARLARRRIILIEHETTHESTRHFPRNYQTIFEGLGWRQVEEVFPFPGLPKAYYGRVFEPAS